MLGHGRWTEAEHLFYDDLSDWRYCYKAGEYFWRNGMKTWNGKPIKFVAAFDEAEFGVRLT
jgi:hypothetical protein